MKKKIAMKNEFEEVEVTLDSEALENAKKIAQQEGLSVSSLFEKWITQKVLSSQI